MKKAWVILLSCIIGFAIYGCSAKKAGNPAPEEVIKTYFKAQNEKNLTLLQSTLTEDWKRPGVLWGLENLEYIKLISMDESKATIKKDSYMESGKGKLLKPIDVKIYWVEWDKKYIDPKQSANGKDGKDAWNFILVKTSKDGPWLINDMGH